MGLAFYLAEAPHLRGGGSRFVDGMMGELMSSVIERGRWHRSYDYDGQGTFFKTTVGVISLDTPDNVNLLNLNAAYVGKEVEDGLAEYLGVGQGLQWKHAAVGLEPVEDHMQVDFDQVVQRLAPVVRDLQPVPQGKTTYNLLPSRTIGNFRLPFSGRSRLVKNDNSYERVTGENIVRYLTSFDEYGHLISGPFTLGVVDGIEVTLGLGRVGERFYDSRTGQRANDRWQANGAILTAPLAEDYSDPSKLVPPAIIIATQRFSERSYDRLPAVDPKMKATMNEITARVASAFGKVA